MALQSAAALVNTDQRYAAGGVDELNDVAALDAFVQRWQWTGERRRDHDELDGVRALRGELGRLWELDQDDVVDLVNELLRRCHALPQLVRHDQWDYHLHATPSDAPLADRMAVEAAMAMVDIVRAGELDRLRTCAADGCRDALVDLSRNHSRRFCSVACANRTNVAAFRARRSSADTTS